MNAALARGLSHYRSDRLGPADWVTLARATLAVGVAALVADSFAEPVPVALLVSLAVVALALDAVDGWVARRTRTTATLGAHFDAEVDAFLILILSVYVARSAGAWVLAIGAARYAFLAAGWLLPWMRAPLPPRYWRKVVAATQGIVLTIAAADVLPPAADRGRARRRARPACRVVRPRRVVAVEPPAPHTRAGGCGRPGSRGRHSRRPRTRTRANRHRRRAHDPRRFCSCGPPSSLRTSRFISRPTRVPEGPARGSRPDRRWRSSCPPTGRRILAGVVGPAARAGGHPEDPRLRVLRGLRPAVRPLSGLGLRRDRQRDAARSIGASQANLVIAGVVGSPSPLLVLMTLAVLRLTRVAAGHRRWSLRAVAALGAVWVLCWVFGAHLVSHTPIASTSAASLVVDEVQRAAGRHRTTTRSSPSRSATTASATPPPTSC